MPGGVLPPDFSRQEYVSLHFIWIAVVHIQHCFQKMHCKYGLINSGSSKLIGEDGQVPL